MGLSRRGLDYFLGHLDTFREKYDPEGAGSNNTDLVKARLEGDAFDAEFLLRGIARTASRLASDLETARIAVWETEG